MRKVKITAGQAVEKLNDSFEAINKRTKYILGKESGDILSEDEMTEPEEVLREGKLNIFYKAITDGMKTFKELSESLEKMSSVLASCEVNAGDALKVFNQQKDPIVVKSGETYVAHSKGVDYICLDPWNYLEDILKDPPLVFDIIETTGFGRTERGGWENILEVEITDEIAKLRPMMRTEQYGLQKLWGIRSDSGRPFICSDSGKDVKEWVWLGLATVKDLTEVTE